MQTRTRSLVIVGLILTAIDKVASQAVGDTCLGIADCGWDSIPFIECRNDGAGLQCLCQSGYYGDVGTTTCNSVGIGDSCATTDICVSIPNSECRNDGAGAQCLCLTGYYGNTGDKTCTVMAVGDTCLGIADCGWDSIPFIECRNDGAGLQCLCQSGYYGDVGTTTCNSVGIGDSCATTDICVSIPNSECRNDGAGAQCLCLTGYYGNTGDKTCTVMDCGSTDPVNNGTFAGRTHYNGGAEIICSEGFVGDGAAACLPNGAWAALPTCLPIDCTDVPIPHGTIDGDTTFWGTANVNCKIGYEPGGPAYCLDSGSWDTLPQCNPVDCGEPDIPNGALSTASNTTFNGSAVVECDAGYEVQGSDIATCLSSGNWDILPTCQPKDCGQPPVDNGALAPGSVTHYAGIALVKCDPGYKGDSLAMCSEYGNWTTLPTCSPIDCGQLFISYGFLAAGSSTLYAGTATVECDPGYQVLGSTTASCLTTGDWDTPPQCTPKDCGDPGDPNGGITGDSEFGRIASISCNTGYTGGGSITCLDTGVWDKSAATACVLVDCGSPGDPNGALAGSSKYSGTASIACNTGYVGGGTITCLASGDWNTTMATTCVLDDCGPLAAPLNGDVDVTATTYGSSATFSCDDLYEMNGNPVLTCEAGGSWSSPPPVCDDIDCPSLTPPTDGSLSLTAVSVGTSVDVLCDATYSLFGVTPLTCVTGGNWSDVVGICKRDCSSLTAPTDGEIDTTEVKEGTTVTVTCNKGYTMFGDSVLECLAGSVWNTSVPVCVRECGPLTNPDYGIVSHPDGTTLDNIATYTCDTGYYMYHSHMPTRVCQSDGTWSNTPPICIIHDCGTLLPLTNGTISYPVDTTYNQVATHSCNIGFDLYGDTNRTCQSDGTWDLSEPTCVIRDCGALEAPDNGNLTYTNGLTTYQEFAIFTCDPGYTMIGVAQRECLADPVWSGSSPVCEIKDCGPLNNPANGGVNTAPGTTFGEVATYFCDPGYSLSGDSERECLSDGKWGSIAPNCIIKDCGTLPNPDNGGVSYSNGVTTYQEVATFTCDAGYILTGVVTRTCLASGNWDGSSPVCVIKDCGTLGNFANGRVNTSAGTTFGEVATYFCHPGYDLIGASQRNCQSDGQWGGSVPTCQIKDCGSLHSPVHGSVSVPVTTYDAIAYYSCNAGYDLAGVPSRVCQSDGTWSDLNPACQLKDCGSPPEIEHGDSTTPTGTLFGALAIYSCDVNYGFAGDAAVPCLDTGLWGTNPVCSQDCGSPPSIENGYFVLLSNTLVGATATYICNTGFEMVRNANATCQSDFTWSSAPGCRRVIKAHGEECLDTVQCDTKRATCRSDNLGTTRCICADPGEVYDPSVDTCLTDCGNLTDPIDGWVTLPKVTSEGQIAIYSCNIGFALSDTSLAIRLCLQTGDWSGSAPSCELGCPIPVPPRRGYVNVTLGIVAGSEIFYGCSNGFALKGGDSRICLSDTTWSGNDPICSVECPALSSISYGHVDLSGGQWEGSVATYVCVNDYALVGAAVRKCLSTGMWTGIEPTCIFAIFPDVVVVIGSILVFLLIVDIFICVFCAYVRYSREKPNLPALYLANITEEEAQGNFCDLGSNGPVAVHGSRTTTGQATGRYEGPGTETPPPSPFPKQARSTLPRIRKEDDRSDFDIRQKLYDSDLKPYADIKPHNYKNDLVPLVTPRSIPESRLKAEEQRKQKEKLDFERFLREEGISPSLSDSQEELFASDDEDQISPDHTGNPAFRKAVNFRKRDKKTAVSDKRPITKMEDASSVFKGRMSLPKVPDGVGPDIDNERFYSEEARRYLKESVEAYSPTKTPA